MSNEKKKAIIHFDPAVLEALQHKALQTNRSVSKLVDAAVGRALAEDAEDLAAFEERAVEPLIPFVIFIDELKESGRL